MNNCAFTGRLTKKPEIALTANQTKYARFTIAVDNGKDANGNKLTEFINCIAWKKTAEITAADWFQKGTMVALTGRYHTSSYTDTNGQKRESVEINVLNIEAISPKNQEPKPEAAPPMVEDPTAPIGDPMASVSEDPTAPTGDPMAPTGSLPFEI